MYLVGSGFEFEASDFGDLGSDFDVEPFLGVQALEFKIKYTIKVPCGFGLQFRQQYHLGPRDLTGGGYLQHDGFRC